MTINQLFTFCYVRDNHICQDCGNAENLEIHHKLPISQGGKNHIDNLKTVCVDCHKINYRNVHYPKDKSKIIPFHLREKSRTGIVLTKYTPLSLSLSPEELEQIETYQHDNRIKNRTQAILKLVEKGIEKEQSE